MMHRRNIIYLSILKEIARGMGGRVPDDYRELVILHAKDAADSVIQDENRCNKEAFDMGHQLAKSSRHSDEL